MFIQEHVGEPGLVKLDVSISEKNLTDIIDSKSAKTYISKELCKSVQLKEIKRKKIKVQFENSELEDI